MKKITTYSLVHGDTIFDLWVKINKCIQDGWQPFGNLIIDHTIDMKYIQPVVTYSKENEL